MKLLINNKSNMSDGDALITAGKLLKTEGDSILKTRRWCRIIVRSSGVDILVKPQKAGISMTVVDLVYAEDAKK